MLLSKGEAIARIQRIVGGTSPLNVGSSVPADMFTRLNAYLGLSNIGDMPTRGKRISEHLGQAWIAEDFSTGSTVTKPGLNKILRALEATTATRPGERNLQALGIPYVHRSGGVQGSPEPLQRDWDAMDAATRAHQTLESRVAEFVRERGRLPRSPGPGEPIFDLAWTHSEFNVVAEIKSVNARNHRQQVRLGIGQVVEYRIRLARPQQVVRAILAIDGKPTALDRSMAKAVDVLIIGGNDLEAITRAGLV